MSKTAVLSLFYMSLRQASIYHVTQSLHTLNVLSTLLLYATQIWDHFIIFHFCHIFTFLFHLESISTSLLFALFYSFLLLLFLLMLNQ